MAASSNPSRTYVLTFGALALLTVGTVGLSLVRLGPWHLAAGLAIGAVKAALVALVFMHLLRSPARTWLAAGVGLLWLGILIVLTMNDYLVRRESAY